MNQTKTTPKDFFLHLGAIIVLYTSAISLINLGFSIINYCLPDVLSGYFYSGSVAWSISMLVVLVPTLYVLEYLIKKDISNIPEKGDLLIRKWRTFLTIFLTGATLIGDLIALINTYLNGEISDRFIYKFLTILVISGIIFTYYLLERVNTKKFMQKVLAWAGILAVTGGIVGGFMIVGSPTKQRSLKLDSERVSNLQTIQYQIVNYWQRKEKLPVSLNDINDAISNTSVPIDPDTKEVYTYKIKGDKSFELCATFALKSEDMKGRGGSVYDYSVPMTYPSIDSGNDNWKHADGFACFVRTIDPEIYPPNRMPKSLY
jgi:hypothetical protein